jgi:hypothetical protein
MEISIWYQTVKLQLKKVKDEAVPVIGLGGPLGCETSRLPQFLDNRLKGGWQPYEPAALYSQEDSCS